MISVDTNPSSLPCTPIDAFPSMEMCPSPDTSVSLNSLAPPNSLPSTSSHLRLGLTESKIPHSTANSRKKAASEDISYERVNESCIDIYYTMQSPGIHHIHILLYGQHIKGNYLF